MNDEYLIYGETLTNIANSIRSVSNVSTAWTPDEMASYILANLVKPTSRQAAKTYTPSTANQTIPAGTFLTGAATIQGDADWTEGNIKKGVNMWGKTGTLSGIWGDPSTFYGFTAVKSGSFTVASTATSYTVTHNLGVIPKVIIVYGDALQEETSVSGGVLGAMVFQTTTDAYVASGKKTTNGIYMGCKFAYNRSSVKPTTSGDIATTSMRSANSINTITSTNEYASTDIGRVIRSASNTSFIIGANSTNWTGCTKTFKWIAIG